MMTRNDTRDSWLWQDGGPVELGYLSLREYQKRTRQQEAYDRCLREGGVWPPKQVAIVYVSPGRSVEVRGRAEDVEAHLRFIRLWRDHQCPPAELYRNIYR